MINFEHESLEVALKKAYDNVRGLKRKTKELICVGLTVMMLGTFVLYDAAAGAPVKIRCQHGSGQYQKAVRQR